jgi:transposase
LSLILDTYAYGAVSPLDGRFDARILPHVNTDCRRIFLDEIAQRHPNENLIMMMDGAGWHQSLELVLPDKLKTLFLPPYSPELNPQEHPWDELREKYFHNKAFDSLDVLEDNLVTALLVLENNSKLVHPISAWDWIVNALKQ